MICVKLVLAPKKNAIEGGAPSVEVKFLWRGNVAGCKAWQEKFKKDRPEQFVSVEHAIDWCDQYFLENEFWPGPISQVERNWFLPSKMFFNRKKK